MKIHELKILPEYFKVVLSGKKKFEIRKNDRDYRIGDLVILKEYDPIHLEYTGQQFKGKITYLTNYAQSGNYVVFGIIPIITKEQFDGAVDYIRFVLQLSENQNTGLGAEEYQQIMEHLDLMKKFVEMYYQAHPKQRADSQSKEL